MESNIGQHILNKKRPVTKRREFVKKGAHACAAAVAASATGLFNLTNANVPEVQRFLLIGLVGSENPTRANFPFVWAAALQEAGNEVRIELAGDATVLMRSSVSNSVTPVGWPPFKEALAKVVALKIPIYV